MERNVGCKLQLKLNVCLRTVANKYYEGKMQRTTLALSFTLCRDVLPRAHADRAGNCVIQVPSGVGNFASRRPLKRFRSCKALARQKAVHVDPKPISATSRHATEKVLSIFNDWWAPCWRPFWRCDLPFFGEGDHNLSLFAMSVQVSGGFAIR